MEDVKCAIAISYLNAILVEMQACKSINIQQKLKSGKGGCRNWSEAAPGANFGRYVVMVTWVANPILQIDMDALRLSIRVVYAANRYF